MDSRIGLNTNTDQPAEIHHCRAGSSCAGRSRARDSLDWIPHTTDAANTVCTRCRYQIEAAIGALWDDYTSLNALFLVPTEHAGSEIRSGAPGSRVPLNVYSDALMNDIVDTVYRCAALITPEPAASAQTRLAQVVTCRGIVLRNIDTLLAAPPRKHLLWNRAGDDYVAEMLDGVQLALALVALHRRAVMLVGVERPRDRMPVPCPRCESRQLGKNAGSTDVDCRSCGSVWSEADYHRLTQIGASIIREELAR